MKMRNMFTFYVVLLHLMLAWLLLKHNSFLQEMLLIGELVLIINAIWEKVFSENIIFNLFILGMIVASTTILAFSPSTTMLTFLRYLNRPSLFSSGLRSDNQKDRGTAASGTGSTSASYT